MSSFSRAIIRGYLVHWCTALNNTAIYYSNCIFFSPFLFDFVLVCLFLLASLFVFVHARPLACTRTHKILKTYFTFSPTHLRCLTTFSLWLVPRKCSSTFFNNGFGLRCFACVNDALVQPCHTHVCISYVPLLTWARVREQLYQFFQVAGAGLLLDPNSKK